MNASESVLLVDDDVRLRERLARALRERDYDVVDCADTTSALRIAAVREFWGAVVDMRMPGGSGLELIRKLRRLLAPPRIVVLTGYGSIANALEAVQLGAVGYLTKPVEVEILLATLAGERVERDNPKDVPEETPSLDRVEWEHIQRVLADCGGNISQAARLLRIDRRSLQRKLGKYPPVR